MSACDDTKIIMIDECHPIIDKGTIKDFPSVKVEECSVKECSSDKSQSVSFWKRIVRLDYILVYVSYFVTFILFLASYLSGVYSPWYATLKQTTANPWIPRLLWVVATIVSYIGFYILWSHGTQKDTQYLLGISVLYLIGNFIILSWSVALYQANDLGMAVWLAAILFIYQFWIVIVVWYVYPVAAIFLVPLAAMYLYLVYSMIHLASINGWSL